MTPKKKETVRNGKKSKAASTQRFLQFAGVHDDTLVLKNGGLRAVIEIGSVNFNLKSADEQTSLIKSYQQFLNALDFPVQILIQSRKLDIDEYVQELRGKLKTQQNALLREQMLDYIEYITGLVEYADIMQKAFYVVVPANPPRSESKSVLQSFLSYISPDDSVVSILTRRKEFKMLKKELDTRVNVVKTSIGNMGLTMKQLTTAEIIEQLYEVYNPDTARIQKFPSVDAIAIEKQ